MTYVAIMSSSQNPKTTLIITTNNNHLTNTRVKFGQLLNSSDPNLLSPLFHHHENDNDNSNSGSSRHSTTSESTTTTSGESPRLSFYNDDDYSESPCNNNQTTLLSPYINSPWTNFKQLTPPTTPTTSPNQNPIIPRHHNSNSSSSNSNNVYHSRGRNCLIGSLVREEGHVYSLAVRDGVLYTGSQSKNIRVWNHFHDSGGFKCGSGLVKAIVVSFGRVFTGHQDGKIRVWTEDGKRVGSLPKLTDFIKSSVNPRNYVEVRKQHKVPKIKHYDAVSCLTLNEELGLLYSGSWDKTIKVWRVKDGKCLESIEAHDDAINSIVVGFGFSEMVFSGSADGTVKVWRRDLVGSIMRHFHVRTLLRQENAVTSLAVADGGGGGGGAAVLYCGSSDGLVNFWEREKEEVVYGGVLRGHKLAVLCLATAGCLVFSGSADKSICVWRREESGGGDHSCLAVLSGHCGPVKCLAVEEDRHDDDEWRRNWIVYSGSLDRSVRIWRVSEHAPDESST